ncbi:MAG: hypothetical protein DRN08_03290, partial [Thermoplasmata archaeon]
TQTYIKPAFFKKCFYHATPSTIYQKKNMEKIPIIQIKKRKILKKTEEKKTKYIHIDEILPNTETHQKVYVEDLDGIEKNKPNLDIYQKIAERHNELWIDQGPRTIGDVVDTVMTGAKHVTIRKNLFPEEEIPNLRNIIESKIYILIDHKQLKNKQHTFYTTTEDIDGLVLSISKKDIETDFKTSEQIKNICRKYKVYVREAENIHYWEKIGATGLLINIHIK